MLWKVKGQHIEPIEKTDFSEAQFLERDLETWIEANPAIRPGESSIVSRRTSS